MLRWPNATGLLYSPCGRNRLARHRYAASPADRGSLDPLSPPLEAVGSTSRNTPAPCVDRLLSSASPQHCGTTECTDPADRIANPGFRAPPIPIVPAPRACVRPPYSARSWPAMNSRGLCALCLPVPFSLCSTDPCRCSCAAADWPGSEFRHSRARARAPSGRKRSFPHRARATAAAVPVSETKRGWPRRCRGRVSRSADTYLAHLAAAALDARAPPPG